MIWQSHFRFKKQVKDYLILKLLGPSTLLEKKLMNNEKYSPLHEDEEDCYRSLLPLVDALMNQKNTPEWVARSTLELSLNFVII